MNNALNAPTDMPLNAMTELIGHQPVAPGQLMPAKSLDWDEEEFTTSPLRETPAYKFALKELAALVPFARNLEQGKSNFSESLLAAVAWPRDVRRYDFTTRAKRKAFANKMHHLTDGADSHSYVNAYVNILVKRYGRRPKVMLNLDAVFFMEMLVQRTINPQPDIL